MSQRLVNVQHPPVLDVSLGSERAQGERLLAVLIVINIATWRFGRSFVEDGGSNHSTSSLKTEFEMRDPQGATNLHKVVSALFPQELTSVHQNITASNIRTNNAHAHQTLKVN